MFLKYLGVYLLTVSSLLLVDFMWLGLVAKGFYQKYLGFLIKGNFNIWVGLIFYLFYTLGILILVVFPHKDKGMLTVLLFGCLLGALAYSAYDLTNLATIKNWPVIVTVVDLLWGIFLTGLISVVGYLVVKWII